MFLNTVRCHWPPCRSLSVCVCRLQAFPTTADQAKLSPELLRKVEEVRGQPFVKNCVTCPVSVDHDIQAWRWTSKPMRLSRAVLGGPQCQDVLTAVYWAVRVAHLEGKGKC